MTEPTIRVGTIGYPVKKQLVHDSVDVVELTEAQAAPPNLSTAKRWKKEASNRLAFTVQLPRYLYESLPANMPLGGKPEAYGVFQTSRENLGLFDKTMKFADAMEADTIVLLTPPEFTPTQANREALTEFLQTAKWHGRDIVWEPRGPWEYEQAAAFAGDLGMILAVDPLRDPPSSGAAAYFRLGPFAVMGSRVGIYDLERLAEAAAPFERVTCVFATPHALDDARNLKKVLSETY
jgi:uncharacterized protein YecE (DUF72 family)